SQRRAIDTINDAIVPQDGCTFPTTVTRMQQVPVLDKQLIIIKIFGLAVPGCGALDTSSGQTPPKCNLRSSVRSGQNKISRQPKPRADTRSNARVAAFMGNP